MLLESILDLGKCPNMFYGIFLLFHFTKSHLTTKPYNFDIKCQCNLESYKQQIFFGTKFRGGVVFFKIMMGVFFWQDWLTGWTSFEDYLKELLLHLRVTSYNNNPMKILNFKSYQLQHLIHTKGYI